MKFENRVSARLTLKSSFVVANDVVLIVIYKVLAFILCTGVPVCFFIYVFPPFPTDISILDVTQ